MTKKAIVNKSIAMTLVTCPPEVRLMKSFPDLPIVVSS
jgi:hypothetical protein